MSTRRSCPCVSKESACLIYIPYGLTRCFDVRLAAVSLKSALTSLDVVISLPTLDPFHIHTPTPAVALAVPLSSCFIFILFFLFQRAPVPSATNRRILQRGGAEHEQRQRLPRHSEGMHTFTDGLFCYPQGRGGGCCLGSDSKDEVKWNGCDRVQRFAQCVRLPQDTAGVRCPPPPCLFGVLFVPNVFPLFHPRRRYVCSGELFGRRQPLASLALACFDVAWLHLIECSL